MAAGSLRHLPYLFERLYRAEAAWDRAYEWAGIGLAISHSIVRAHGGTVTVDSAGPDHSAVFTVELSLVASNRPQPRST
ncbi:ATP-binding protein [Pseudactinotalea sp. Z1732]|uniref:ATP-binding protein n=1 Tax=Micrococcales TaxID=85006 RepID=UPI003C7D599B